MDGVGSVGGVVVVDPGTVVVPRPRRVGERLFELVLELVLGAGGLEVRAPQLVGDEQQQHHAGGDQEPSDRSEDTAREATGRVWRGSPELAAEAPGRSQPCGAG